MKLKQLPHRDSRPRSTLCLRGTIRSTEVKADHHTDLGLAYASEWLTRAGSLRPSSSAIVRRAVAVYLRHLETVDPGHEVRDVRLASDSIKPDEEDREAALKRLHDADKGQPLPPFRDILLGSEARKRIHEVTERAEALARGWGWPRRSPSNQ